jgi:catechol 2,3-dioxygenase-like lactoylglutathione lyase family enzyme
MKALFEVVILPVSDADRSLRFYCDQLGFELDVDYAPSPDFRVVQLTPHGSNSSIQFGVSEIRRKDTDGGWRGGYLPGLDPGRSDYASFADLRDPDGNAWVLQERGYRPT